MDLNQHIVTTNTSKPFHSNGFAKGANGNRLGPTTSMSFEQRKQIDRNRRLVANYQRSNIGNAYGVLRARPAPVIRRAIIGRSAPHSPLIHR
jgi:hypothetical protein